MVMREPWDLAQSFINNLNQSTAQAQNVADNALMRVFSEAIGRGNQAIAQNYNAANLAQRNQYAVEADTVANQRQKEIMQMQQANRQNEINQQREWQLQDNAAARDAAIAKEDRAYHRELELNKARQGSDEGDGTPPGYWGGASQSQSPQSPQSNNNSNGFNMDAYERATIQRESGGRRYAKNSLSSATGLHQFIDATWNGVRAAHPDLNLTPDGRTDPEQSSRAFRAFTRDNQKILAANGVPITGGTSYAAHFLGPYRAVRILSHGNDSTPISAIIPADVEKANPHLRGKTVGQFKQWTNEIGKKMGDGGSGSGTYSASSDDGGGGGDSRRYSGDQDSSFTVANSAGNIRNDETSVPQMQPIKVSNSLSESLEKDGLIPVQRKYFTETQLSMMTPEQRSSIRVDPEDFVQTKRPAYIVTARKPVDPNSVEAKTQTHTPSNIPVANTNKTGRVVFKNGRAVRETSDGKEIALE